MDMFTPEEIRAIRKKLGLTATQFAVRIGVSENAVRRWEGGSRHPKFDHIVKLHELRDGVAVNGRKKAKVTA